MSDQPEATRYVVVIIGVDGSVSAMGTHTGRPYRSGRVARAVARRWEAAGCQAEVCPLDEREDPR